MQLRTARTALLLLALAAACMAPPHQVLAADCPVKPMLTVKDTQDGFAGTTGTIWTIKSDCSYDVARLRGSEVSPPHLKGQLTPEQQSQLAAALSAAAVETLPARIGEPAPVNSRQISIEYGGKTAVLNLGMGDPALQGASNDAAHRVVEIGRIVKAVTGEK
jgi:hypothetical protein